MQTVQFPMIKFVPAVQSYSGVTFVITEQELKEGRNLEADLRQARNLASLRGDLKTEHIMSRQLELMRKAREEWDSSHP